MFTVGDIGYLDADGTTALISSPKSSWGMQPADGVAPGPALTAELLAFLDGRIATFKLPRTIDYVAELPRDPNGKLYKRRLRDPSWAARDKSI